MQNTAERIAAALSFTVFVVVTVFTRNIGFEVW